MDKLNDWAWKNHRVESHEAKGWPEHFLNSLDYKLPRGKKVDGHLVMFTYVALKHQKMLRGMHRVHAGMANKVLLLLTSSHYNLNLKDPKISLVNEALEDESRRVQLLPRVYDKSYKQLKTLLMQTVNSPRWFRICKLLGHDWEGDKHEVSDAWRDMVDWMSRLGRDRKQWLDRLADFREIEAQLGDGTDVDLVYDDTWDSDQVTDQASVMLSGVFDFDSIGEYKKDWYEFLPSMREIDYFIRNLESEEGYCQVVQTALRDLSGYPFHRDWASSPDVPSWNAVVRMADPSREWFSIPQVLRLQILSRATKRCQRNDCHASRPIHGESYWGGYCPYANRGRYCYAEGAAHSNSSTTVLVGNNRVAMIVPTDNDLLLGAICEFAIPSRSEWKLKLKLYDNWLHVSY